MKRILIIASLAILAATLQAAPKAEVKKERKDSRYGAPSETSLVGLTGGETPDQIKKAYADALAALLPVIGNDDAKAFQSLEATINHAARPGAEAERTACCLAVADAYNVATQTIVRVTLLQQLINVGKAESVAFETTLLADAEPWIRETARCALQNNPAPEAAVALRDALAKATESATKSAMALALAARKDVASVPAIAKLLAEKDDGVVVAALGSLAQIGGLDAAKILYQLMTDARGAIQQSAADGWLKVAHQLTPQGNYELGSPVGHTTSVVPTPLAASSERLIFFRSGTNDAKHVIALLSKQHEFLQTIGLGLISELSGSARQQLAAAIEQLSPDMQGIVLGSLAGLGEKAALPVALKFARGQDAALRTSGLKALAQLGDASSAGMVCDALAASQDKAERSQLEQLLIVFPGGTATDEAIIAAMKKATGETRLSLMNVLGKRNSRPAVPVLLAETASDDANAAKYAFQNLGSLAMADDVPALLEKVAAVKASQLRNDADSAASRALAKVEQSAKRSEMVLKAFGDAPSADARKSQLKLLSACADEKALDVVTAALKDDDAGIREAAVRSLSSWLDATAWDALMRIYSQPEKEAFGTIALRGLVRLVQSDKRLSGMKLVERYRPLMAGARSDGDRKLILGGLGAADHPTALDLALPLLSNPAIRPETEKAIRNIAESIKKNHPDVARAALDRLK